MRESMQILLGAWWLKRTLAPQGSTDASPHRIAATADKNQNLNLFETKERASYNIGKIKLSETQNLIPSDDGMQNSFKEVDNTFLCTIKTLMKRHLAYV